ncbi:hypothetical protein BDR04DRAFT_1094831, partial [Suillus decipiens]
LEETANTDTSSFATYMVSGQITPPYGNESLVDAMDVAQDDDNAHQSVVCSRIVLVDCDGLQNAKAQFSHVHSVYIYSLSPSVLRDTGLICQPTLCSVWDTDTKGNPVLNGKVIVHVHDLTKSSVLPQKLEQITDKGKQNEVSKGKEHAKPLAATKEQPKPTAKLDWSKGKSKEQETTSGARIKDKDKPQPRQDIKASSSSTKLIEKPSGNSDVGLQSTKKPISKAPAVELKVRRINPSDSDVDDEDKPAPKDRKARLSVMSNARVKKGVVHTRPTSDSERSLTAMMDIDDDQVVRVSRLSSRCPDEVVDDTGDEVDQIDLDALISSLGEEEEDIKPQAKKRKSKKVVPVGRNGLKKCRVLKSRTTTDAKGYMHYSSYESVSEEEAVAKGAKKRKPKKVVPVGCNGLKKTYSSYESISEDEVVEVALEDAKKSKGKKKAEPKLKDEAGDKSGQANSKRGSLLNFFGPDESKK